jgi:uncharacterized repeat protein (TIGR02543 family)
MIYIENKKYSNIFKKLVFILILFTFGINVAKAATISFESHGGPDVDSYEISTDKLGELPSPTMDGYLFDGWYKEATYLNKVSSKTEVTGDMTLHARWVYNPFPFVYPYHAEDFICTGSTYVNTGVSLYTGPNGDEEGTWDKDYEIGFTIEAYDPNEQPETQSVFMNTKYENQALSWPGLVVRKSGDKIEITQTIDSGKVQRYINDLIFPMNVKIKRKNKVVYYQVNGGRLYTVQDMSVFTRYFDTPVYFCAGDNGSGGVQRYLKGTISNYYVRMGTYEDLETHTVTYPDGTIKVHGHNEVVELGSNDGPADVENITLTFKYNNGSSDTTSTKIKTTTHHGFNVGDVHYDSDATLVVDEDKVIELDDDIEVTGSFEFPTDPEKEHYIFDGWFDENDTEYTEYDGETDLTLNARYTGEDVTIHTPNGDETVHYGDTYNLGANTIPKSNDNLSSVTFKLHNGKSDITKYVEKTYTNNGWTISAAHYNDNENITIEGEITIEPGYIDSIVPVEFPSDPTKKGYDFGGWYTEETGGEKIESYDETVDIILHAQYVEHIPIITTPYGTYNPDENGNFTLETNDVFKTPIYSTYVTFYKQNGQRDSGDQLTKSYTPNGWLIDGVHYDDEEVISVTKDIEVIPDYIEDDHYPVFPRVTKEGYEFGGWFDAINGGDEYTEVTDYNGPARLYLYARWIKIPTDTNYKLPINDIPKENTHRATITFKYENGGADVTREVETRYTPNGWLVDGVHYDSNAYIYKDENTVIEPDYIAVRVNALFPAKPSRYQYKFAGWYTEPNGQGERVTVLNKDEDLVLYAKWSNNYALLKGRSAINLGATGTDNTLRPGTEEEYNYAVENNLTIRNNEKSESPNPVYMWQNGTDVIYYSPADEIFMDSDASQLFQNKSSIYTRIDLSGLNSIDVTTTFNMFAYCYADEIDLTNFDTSSVTNMKTMFRNDSVAELDLSSFDTSKVTDMSGMFFQTNYLTKLDLSSFDTRNVTTFVGMFNSAFYYQTRDYVLDLNHFDTSKATNMNSMFYECHAKDIKVKTWDTSRATDMNSMFCNIYVTELDVSSFDTSNVTNMEEMFSSGTSLKTIYVSDKFDTSNVTNDTNMFTYDTNLVGQQGTKYNASNVGKDYAVVDVPNLQQPGYFTNIYPDFYVVSILNNSDLVEYGGKYIFPTNNEESDIPDTTLATVTFKYHDNVTEDTTSTVKNTNMPSGWIVDGVHYDNKAELIVTKDIEVIPDFVEVTVGAEFPELTRVGYTFLGWYTEEEGGEKIEEYNSLEDITLHARWEASFPVDMELDSDDITMVVGDTHLIDVTFIPDGTSDSLIYSDYDENVIDLTEGLITAIAKGTTTITVGTENTDITKTISVTIVSDKLESEVYEVRDKTHADDSTSRIIIGAEVGTTIGEFKDNLLNPNEYVKIYDTNGIELQDTDIVMTGQVIKLVYGQNVMDEAIMVVRGDINGDGFVNVMDDIAITNTITDANPINEASDYARFAAADVEEDDFINVIDEVKITSFITNNIDSLNE